MSTRTWEMVFYLQGTGRVETIVYARTMSEARRMVENQYGDLLTYIASQIELT